MKSDLTIEFFPDTHEYLVNGEKAKISVTTLIGNQLFAEEYAGIDPAILQKAADRGTEIHADLEYFVGKGTEPKTQSCKNFANYIKANNWKIEEPKCEFKMAIRHTANAANGAIFSFILSGTADLICKLNGKWVIVDHKTTSSIHYESVRWQMSILDYMARQLNGLVINGELFTYHPAEELYVFHFSKSDVFKPVKVEPIPDIEIQRLLDAEAQDKEYHPTPVEIITPKQQTDLLELQKKLCSIKAAQSQLEAEEKRIRAELEAAFIAHPGTRTVQLDTMTVTYVMPTTKTSFDADKFALEHPDIYAQYLKTSSVKGSVKITLAKSVKDMIEAHSSEIPLLPPKKNQVRKNTKRGYFS